MWYMRPILCETWKAHLVWDLRGPSCVRPERPMLYETWETCGIWGPCCMRPERPVVYEAHVVWDMRPLVYEAYIVWDLRGSWYMRPMLCETWEAHGIWGPCVRPDRPMGYEAHVWDLRGHVVWELRPVVHEAYIVLDLRGPWYMRPILCETWEAHVISGPCCVRPERPMVYEAHVVWDLRDHVVYEAHMWDLRGPWYMRPMLYETWEAHGTWGPCCVILERPVVYEAYIVWDLRDSLAVRTWQLRQSWQ